MTHSLERFEQWAVRILCAVAIVLVGLAHRPPALAKADGVPANYAEYALPDGSLPTLCVTVTDDNGAEDHDGNHHDKRFDRGCEACRIGAATLLPVPVEIADTLFRTYQPVELPLRQQIVHRPSFPPNTGPRAPPHLLIVV